MADRCIVQRHSDHDTVHFINVRDPQNKNLKTNKRIGVFEHQPATLFTLSHIHLAVYFHFTCFINHWKRLNEIPIYVCFTAWSQKSQRQLCVCLSCFFFLPLHLNCLLPVLFHLSLLDGDMYAIIIPFFPCARESSGLHQTEQKEREQRRYLRVKAEKEEGKKSLKLN